MKTSHLSASAIKLSVLIPAFDEEKTLPILVSELLRQATAAGALHPHDEVEIVIASDDGVDYAGLLPKDPRLVFCPPLVKTGPAVARTRALHAATGTHIVPIDADDTVSATFIPSVLQALKSSPAVATRARYRRDGQVIRALTGDELTKESFLGFSGSVPIVTPRHWVHAYPDVVAEDAVSVINALHRAGGRLKVIDAAYNIETHDLSYCARTGSSFAQRYAAHLQEAQQIAKTIGNPAIAAAVAELFIQRIDMNGKYEAELERGHAMDYNDFVVKQAQLDKEKAVARHPTDFANFKPHNHVAEDSSLSH
jgi:glycosyltransferase involved in cell wall biosynthesis